MAADGGRWRPMAADGGRWRPMAAPHPCSSAPLHEALYVFSAEDFCYSAVKNQPALGKKNSLKLPR